MFPPYHIIINLIISLSLVSVISPIFILIFFLSSFLIDIDHYLYYIYVKKDFSLKRAFNHYIEHKKRIKEMPRKERSNFYNFIFIFHGIEPIIILFLLSFYYYPLLFVSLGFFAHLIEDLLEHISLGMFRKKLFLSYALYKNLK